MYGAEADRRPFTASPSPWHCEYADLVGEGDRALIE